MTGLTFSPQDWDVTTAGIRPARARTVSRVMLGLYVQDSV